jgi:hypothetical protein
MDAESLTIGDSVIDGGCYCYQSNPLIRLEPRDKVVSVGHHISGRMVVVTEQGHVYRIESIFDGEVIEVQRK